MSTGYQISEQNELHYVTFQVVRWIDIFASLSGKTFAALHRGRISNSTVLNDGISNAAEQGYAGATPTLQYMLQPEGLIALEGSTYVYKYFKSDHVSSTRVVLAARQGTMVAEQNTDYYPFGLTWSYDDLNQNKYLFSGKELQDGQMGFGILGWYDFHARYYNPVLGRWFNQDPAHQLANPYSYCGNSPMMYIDKDGKFIWFIPVIIGAVIGGYSGYKIGEANGAKGWDMFGYIAGGAVIGGVSGYVGGTIAAEGGFMANTMGIAAGSFYNSVGMSVLSEGMVHPSVSLGVASVDLETGKWGYLGKKGNKWYQDVAYGLGALANLKDVNDIINATTVNLYTQTKNPDGSFDAISHSGIKSPDGEVMMSYGPASEAKLPGYAGFAVEPKLSTPDYPIPEDLSLQSEAFTVNKYLFSGLKEVSRYTLYQGVSSNCVNWSSLGLWLNGIPNIGIHPFLLYGSMAVYNSGAYNVLASQLTSYPGNIKK